MIRPRSHILVAIDGDTVLAGAREVKHRLVNELARHHLGDEIQVIETGSFGPSDAGVILAVQPEGVIYAGIRPQDVPELVENHLVKGRYCSRWLLPPRYDLPVPGVDDARDRQRGGRIVLENCGLIDPDSIEEYIARDGYFGLAKALTEMTPEEVIEEVKRSGLRGRGGAGFPTGLKWSFCLPQKARPKYVICNADEGEPGTFKDRLILEGDPHKVLEGMAICAYAIGAEKGYVYIRGEYALSIERMQRAIDAARAKGLLGRGIFGTKFKFDVAIRRGAGAYVCGEETALIESMEGKRGIPRLKPPFPAQAGYLGKPTNVNNVETLANVPAILRNGAAWFKGIGTAGTAGTKVYTLLGHVNRPGLIEVPVGVTLREIIRDYAGGMCEGTFKMAQLGGTAGDLLSADVLDVPLDYDALAKVGHVLGSGAILVMNPSVEVADFLHACIRFFLHESCGNCNPCRNGLRVLYDISGRLRLHQGRRGDIEAMEEIALMMKQAAFCPLGQSPAMPIMSATRYFREELESAVHAETPPPPLRRTHREQYSFAG